MSTDEKYNGWTNYETWCVNLWLSNDEGSQSYWAERAELLWGDYWNSDDREYDGQTQFEAAQGELARELESEHDDRLHGMGNSLLLDLLQSALNVVNWHEIAAGLLDGQGYENVPDPEPTDDDDEPQAEAVSA